MPKDFPIQKIHSCEVYTNVDTCVFTGFDIDIRQTSPKEEYAGFGMKRTVAGEVELKIKGQPIASVENPIQTIVSVSFEIKVQRLDVIEILKHGQFIKIKGSGIISDIGYHTDFTEITIKVNGQLDIK